MNTNIIIGNLCTLLAMGLNTLSATKKNTKSMLRMQSVSQSIYCISGIVLGGYSAAVQNVVSILRNVAAIRNITNKTVQWVLTAAGVVLGVVFNNRGVMGLLPVIGTLQYTLVIFHRRDNERLLKISYLISSFMFVIFNVVLYNVVGVISDLIVCITTATVLIKDMRKKA